MTAYPIPDDAIDDRLAIVGTSGSGKTYAMMTAVERLLERKTKVVMVDPLGVSWGIRLKANGKDPAFPVVIFGGKHADIPMTEQSGRLIGEAVAGMSDSAVIDLSELGSKAAERRFMLGFLEAMYRNAAGEPFHLIFDEADLWAPQRSLEPQRQNLMENIVRRGRVKGFIPWLITQRPAVISKDVLSQVDGLIAMKLVSKQDRDALGAWIEGQADRAEQKDFNAKLPTMQRGHGIVWMPGRGILKTVKFPAKTTFDSSRTPERGETKRTAELKPIDIGKLKVALAAIEIERTKPKAVAPATAKASASAAALGQPEIDRAINVAVDKALAEARPRIFEEGRRVGITEGHRDALKGVQAAIGAIKANEPTLAALPPRPASALAAPVSSMTPPMSGERARMSGISSPASTRKPEMTTGGAMSKAGRLILTALAQYPAGRTKTQIAILTGYSGSGGGFRNALGALRSKQWIEGSETLQITLGGVVALGPFDPLPHGQQLLQHWYGQLGKAERAILAAVADVHPQMLTREQIAERTGYEPGGGGFRNALGRLRSLELIVGSRDIKASDDFFPQDQTAAERLASAQA